MFDYCFLDNLAFSSSVITDREEDLSIATQAGSFHSSFTCLPTTLRNEHLVNKFLAAMKAC